MLPRLVLAAVLAASLALPREDDRGRPVILMLHGRGMLDRDTAELRKLWYDGLTSGAKLLPHGPAIAERDLRLVWCARGLRPRSAESCDYSASDPRARRDAATDPNLKMFVGIVGNILGAITNLAADGEPASQLRALSADASFLSDAHKRCASERRLADALDR